MFLVEFFRTKFAFLLSGSGKPKSGDTSDTDTQHDLNALHGRKSFQVDELLMRIDFSGSKPNKQLSNTLPFH